jgi:hypothetical protein
MTFPIEGKCPVCNEFPCTNIKVCWRVIEIEKDLAAAVEVLRKIATHPIYGIDPIEIVQIARAFLARMEVKP